MMSEEDAMVANTGTNPPCIDTSLCTAGRALKAMMTRATAFLCRGKERAIINQLLELEGAPDYDLVTDAERYSVGVFQHDLIKLKDMDVSFCI